MKLTRNLSPFLSLLLLPSRGLRKLYGWTLHWGRTKHAKFALFSLAFAESSFFPIPPDVLLIAMTVADRAKWWILAILTTAGSVLGGMFGYYIGLTLFDAIGKPILEFYHFQSVFDLVRLKYEEHAFLAVFTAAFTPIPYKVFTIAGGVFRISFLDLIVASIAGRGGRFFAVALALRIFGKRISETIEKYFDILSFVFAALLIGGFFAVKFFLR